MAVEKMTLSAYRFTVSPINHFHCATWIFREQLKTAYGTKEANLPLHNQNMREGLFYPVAIPR